MPVAIACPHCAARLRVADAVANSGKKVKCPKCTGAVPTQAPEPEIPVAEVDEAPVKPARSRVDSAQAVIAKPKAPPPPEESEEEEEAPRPRRRRPEAEDDDTRPRRREADDEESDRPRKTDWDKVRIGVGLVYLGICVVLGAMVIGLFGVPMTLVFESGWFVLGYSALAFLIIGVGGLMSFVGEIFCCFSPAKKGAQVLAMVTLGLTVLSFILNFIGAFVPLLAPVSMIAGAAHAIVFMFYLRALALILKDRDLATSIFRLVIGTGVLALLGVLVLVLILVMFAGALGAAGAGRSSAGGGLLAAVGIVGILVLLLELLALVLALGIYGWFMASLHAVLSRVSDKAGNSLSPGLPRWVGLTIAVAVLFLIDIGIVVYKVNQVGDTMAKDSTRAPATAPMGMPPPVMTNPPPVVFNPPPPVVFNPPPVAPNPPPMVNPPPVVNPPVANPPPAVDPMPPAPPVGNKRLTVANFAAINAGMTEAQVVALLGAPARSNASRLPAGKGRPAIELKVVTWTEGGALVVVNFQANRVVNKSASGVR
jgi:predicted Zn finger-like uncharacterized protein